MDTTGKVRLAVANLRAGVSKLQSDDDWKRALDMQAKFHRYSFANCTLIRMQCPDATRVAGFHAWKKLGRSVKKGEKGIQILAPAGIGRREIERADGTTDERTWMRFRIAYVFDVSQTEGKPIADFAEPIKLDEESFASSVDELRKVALALPNGVVSDVEIRSRAAGDPARACGWYNLMTKAIVVVTDDATRAQQFKTLVHEIAHAILHPAAEHHAAPVREVEAESVAYVVCQALGLNSSSYSFPYVSHWAQGESAAKLVQQSGERIAKTARTILEALESHRPTGDDDDDKRDSNDEQEVTHDIETANTLRVPPMLFPGASQPSTSAVYADGVSSRVSGEQDDAASIAAQKAAKQASNAKRALEAASDLAENAIHVGDARAVDTRILLGSLLASSANKWIAFTLGNATHTFARPRLARCAAVLKRRADLTAFFDTEGLHLRWKDGRGGLDLYGGDAPKAESAVLRVVFPARSLYAPLELGEHAPAALANETRPAAARPDEVESCGDRSACESAAPAPCVRATTRWHKFQAMREIAELFKPAVERTRATRANGDVAVILDVAAFERVSALYGGAAARDHDARLVAAPAFAVGCAP